MAADPRFLEAWVNRRDYRVFGCRLQPLSMWHIMALEAIGSPFMPGYADEADAGDYLNAVAILSARVPENLEVDPDRIIPTRMSILRAIPFKKKCRQANLILEAYFADYWSAIDIWPADETKGIGTINSPWLLVKAIFLMRHTNLSEYRIWSAPIGQMLCYDAALAEQVGGSQVVSLEDLEAMNRSALGETNNGGR